MTHEQSVMVKMRVKVSVLATINAAAKQAGVNRSQFMRAAALAFNPELPVVQPAQPALKLSSVPKRKPEPASPRSTANPPKWCPSTPCEHGYQNSFKCRNAGGGCRM